MFTRKKSDPTGGTTHANKSISFKRIEENANRMINDENQNTLNVSMVDSAKNSPNK